MANDLLSNYIDGIPTGKSTLWGDGFFRIAFSNPLEQKTSASETEIFLLCVAALGERRETQDWEDYGII